MNQNTICPRCHGAQTGCGYCAGIGHVPDQPLSPHFMLSELLVSEAAARLGLANDPPDAYLERLRQVASDLLEPLRVRFGPVHVNSGYRSAAVNSAIGGSGTSAHMQGWAADVIPLTSGITLKAMIDWAVVPGNLEFDQVIHEHSWLHLGRFSPAGAVRREALQMFPDASGKPTYAPYDTNDPRHLI